MSDPIERMQRLRSDVEGGAMLPAAEIRRRGDRLRRRRTAAMAGGAALAVVAIVAPVAFLTGGEPSGDAPVDPANPSETNTSAPAHTTALTEDNLLRDEDVTGAWGDGLDVAAGDTTSGDAAVAPCSRGLADLGATQILTRTFGLSAVDGGDGDADHHVSETIASFPDASAAQQALDQVKSWIDDCEPSGAEQYTAGTWTGVTIPVPGEAELGGGSYGPAEAEPGSQYLIEGRDDLGWILTSGVVVSGNRIAVISDLRLTTGIAGDTGAPVRSILPAAAERLVLDADEESEPSTLWRTDIPGDFPIDRDLSAPEGDPISGPGGNAVGINPLNICGDGRGVHEAEWPRDFVERLAASAPGPAEYLDARELITLPDVQEAQGVLADISSQAEDCSPLGDGQVWTIHDGRALGEETLYLSRTLDFGLGGDVYVFVRVGNAVLAVDAGGEWDLASTVTSGIEDVADTAAAIAPEMCIYSADGC